MAGKYRASGAPKQGGKVPQGRRAIQSSFSRASATVDGISREAMSSTSLLGSAIPKGPLAATIGTSHANAANDLTNSQANAQVDIGTVLGQLDTIARSRSFRASARSAEATPNDSTPLTLESPRMMANGRGPLIVVSGMVPGDVARAAATFDRYGYTVNRAMVPPRLDPMTQYSYWEIRDAAVLGRLPQSARESISRAFERGVTIWTDVAEIGTHPANPANPGVTY